MNRQQLDALNSAGAALKALDLGPVRLRYREADDLIPRETFALWIEATDNSGAIIGTGDTPEAALNDALGQMARKAA